LVAPTTPKVDAAPPRPPQGRLHCAAHQPRSGDIHGQRVVEFLGLDLSNRTADVDSGVVDQDVDPTPAINHLRHYLLDLIGIGHVTDQAYDTPPRQFGNRGSPSLKHIGSAARQYHIRPRPRQRLTDGGAKTAGATGHDGNAAIEAEEVERVAYAWTSV